jgi:hypothetical protein
MYWATFNVLGFNHLAGLDWDQISHNLANAMVARVGDVNNAGRIHRDSRRVPELREGRGTSVTRVPSDASASKRGNNAAGVDFARDVAIGNVDIARPVNGHATGRT